MNRDTKNSLTSISKSNPAIYKHTLPGLLVIHYINNLKKQNHIFFSFAFHSFHMQKSMWQNSIFIHDKNLKFILTTVVHSKSHFHKMSFLITQWTSPLRHSDFFYSFILFVKVFTIILYLLINVFVCLLTMSFTTTETQGELEPCLLESLIYSQSLEHGT